MTIKFKQANKLFVKTTVMCDNFSIFIIINKIKNVYWEVS